MNNLREKSSSYIKASIFILSFLGVALSMLCAKADGYSHAYKRLFYFTGESNLWIGTVSLLILLLPLIKKQETAVRAKNSLYLLRYIFVISITVTGFIFCFVLAPGAKNDNYNAWTLSSVITHIVVPVISILDFFLDEYRIPIKRRHVLYTAIPPFLYAVFASVLGAFGFDFGRGDKFPYFFLNYNSPAGVFGFSDEMPYAIGSFYWIVFILIIVLSLGLIYKKLYKCSK